MFSNVKLQEDDTGYLSGTIYSTRHDAMARVHISAPRGRNNPGDFFRSFLNSSFVGEYETEREAIDSVLFLANARYAAGGLRLQ